MEKFKIIKGAEMSYKVFTQMNVWQEGFELVKETFAFAFSFSSSNTTNKNKPKGK